MITSKTNELIKHIKSLALKKYRDEYNEFIVEGEKMVLEAISEKAEITSLIVSENYEGNIKYNNMETVSNEVFLSISDTKTPQGVLAVIKKKSNADFKKDIIFALDNVQDPGNLGTIIRTLDAFNMCNIILSEGCSDVYNPKVVRSTMGGILRMNYCITKNLRDKLLEYKNNGYKIIVTVLEDSKNLYDLRPRSKSIFVIGNESNGISQTIIDIADEKIKIPMSGKAESLNAGVAASIVAYEIARQNSLK